MLDLPVCCLSQKHKGSEELMNGAWICSSCRRALLLKARRHGQKQLPQRATYIPFSNLDEEQQDSKHRGIPEEESELPRYRRRRAPSHISWQFDRTVEDDFVERISENRSRSSGPYSKPCPRRAPDEQERNTSGEILAYDEIHSQKVRSDGTTSAPRIYTRNQYQLHSRKPGLRSLQSRFSFGIPGNDEQEDIYSPGPTYRHPGRERLVAEQAHGIEDTVATPLNVLPAWSQTRAIDVENFDNVDTLDKAFRQVRPEKRPGVHSSRLNGGSQGYSLDQNFPSMPAPEDQKFQDTFDSLFPQQDTMPPRKKDHILQDDVGLQKPFNAEMVKQQKEANDNEVNSALNILDKALSEDKPASDAWKVYLEMPEWVNRRLRPRTLNAVSQKMISSWCTRACKPGVIPKPIDVIENICAGRGRASEAIILRESLWTLIAHAINYQFSKSTQPTEDIRAILAALSEVWTRLLKTLGECYIRDGQGIIQGLSCSEDWQSFIESEQMHQMGEWSTNSFKTRLFQFFPTNLHSCLKSLDTQALITLILLQESCASNLAKPGEPSALQMNGIYSFFHKLASQCKMKLTQIYAQHSKAIWSHCLNQEDYSKVMEKLVNMTTSAKQVSPNISQIHEASSGQHSPNANEQGSNDMTSVFKRKVGRATENQNVRRLDQLWSEIQTFYTLNSSTKKQVPADLYVQIITSFMALNYPNRAIDAWNQMIQSGLQPNLEHWNAMLKGCGVSRDYVAINELWKNMIESGAKPDAQLWANKIHALAVSGRIEAAIQTFQQMGKEWLEARVSKSSGSNANNKATEVAKPNIQCLNALVGSLARANRHSQLVEVLSWRKELDIRPDSYTYNALLRSALRDRNLDSASTLVQQMISQDIKPDIATFTMMLDAAFQQQDSEESDQLQSSTMEESNGGEIDPLPIGESSGGSPAVHIPTATKLQQSAIDMILAQMARAGIRPTAHTFSTMITGLLRSDPPNVAAAYGVLQHLVSHSLPLPPQVYSSLASYHFNQDPPHYDALVTLWKHAHARRSGPARTVLDAFFYNRFIEGWTKHGEVGRALQARKVALDHGKVQSWHVLRHLFEGLVQSGAWKSAKELVDETQREEQAAGDDPGRSSKGAVAFWETVGAVGLKESDEKFGDDGQEAAVG